MIKTPFSKLPMTVDRVILFLHQRMRFRQVPSSAKVVTVCYLGHVDFCLLVVFRLLFSHFSSSKTSPVFFPSHFSHFLPLTLCIITRQSLSRHSLRSSAGDRVRCYIYISRQDLALSLSPLRPCIVRPGKALLYRVHPLSANCMSHPSPIRNLANYPQLYRQSVGRGSWQERDEGSPPAARS